MSDHEDDILYEAVDTNSPWENHWFLFFVGFVTGGVTVLVLWTHCFTI